MRHFALLSLFSSLLILPSTTLALPRPDHPGPNGRVRFGSEALPAFGPGFDFCGSKCQLGLLRNCVEPDPSEGEQFDCICVSDNYLEGMNDCLQNCDGARDWQKELIIRYRELICNPAARDNEFEQFWRERDLTRPTVAGAIPKATQTFSYTMTPGSPMETFISNAPNPEPTEPPAEETTTEAVPSETDSTATDGPSNTTRTRGPRRTNDSDSDTGSGNSDSEPVSEDDNTSPDASAENNLPLIVGISAGAGVFVLLIIIATVFFIRRHYKRTEIDRNISPSRATSVWGGSVTYDTPILDKALPPPRPISPKTIMARHPSGFPYPPPARPLPLPNRFTLSSPGSEVAVPPGSARPGSARPLLYSPAPPSRGDTKSASPITPATITSQHTIEAFLMPPPAPPKDRPESSASTFDFTNEPPANNAEAEAAGVGIAIGRRQTSMRAEVGSYYSRGRSTVMETETESDVESEDSFSSWDGRPRKTMGRR